MQSLVPTLIGLGLAIAVCIVAAIWGASISPRTLGAFYLLAFVGFLLAPILRFAQRKRVSADSSIA